MENVGDLEKHYAALLGIGHPWVVVSVSLNAAERRVDIELLHDPDRPVHCPVCGSECPRKDHAERRSWRHLDTMQFQTLLHARVPRSACPLHGVRTTTIPWSEPHSRFTLMFTRTAIDVIRACANLTDAARLLGLSWDEVFLIQKKAVRRGLNRRTERTVTYLGIDEKKYRKRRLFATLLNDLGRQSVIDLVESRTKEAADSLIMCMSKRQREGVRAVAMDMALPYREAVAHHLPDAAIVHDKFHIAKYLNEAVEKVWSAENLQLRKMGNDSLSGSRFLWLQNPDTLEGAKQSQLQELRRGTYRVGRAWVLREQFKEFWKSSSRDEARRLFRSWYFRATHSRLTPVIRVARMLKRHLDRLLNYVDHPITNAGSESINARVKTLIARARGFRKFEHLRTAILFHMGDLALYP